MSEQNKFEIAAFDSVFAPPTHLVEMHEGMSITDILRQCDVDLARYPHLQVTLSYGRKSTVIPMQHWSRVKPKAGTHVLIVPVVNGPALPALLSLVVATSAPAIAGALFPTLAAGSLGLAIATAGVSVVGMLLVRAIIPPPEQPNQGSTETNYTLSGASNSAAPYEPFPTVLGRHVMSPVKTATGYSETNGEDIFIRERMTFGYGPVALSELKIGTTPITEFNGVEIEFLNVDQTLTEAAIPDLSSIDVVGWRTGSEAMTLYPDDVSEDSYGVLLDPNVNEVRTTRANTIEAAIDCSLTGLGTYDDKGRAVGLYALVTLAYRAAGTTDPWIDVPDDDGNEPAWNLNYHSLSYMRHTRTIKFPSAGTWAIRLRRTNAYWPDDKARDDITLTAIRSVSSGQIPSNPNIAEIAIRIKASEQLNNRIDNLNAVVQQLAPVWDGASWSAPQPVRHPAWVYAHALMGPQLRDPVDQSRIALDELKAWADEEPHWSCDAVLTGSRRLIDVLDLIAATGRARRGLSDLKFSVIRDGGGGPVVQHFTPENSWNFTGRRFLDRELHALKLRVVSEQQGWETDEVTVYDDGYNSSNATEIETMSLPGVVLDLNDTKQNNAWRLGRYHLAVAKLRGEEFTFYSDLDHVVCQMGSKIRVAHDVPLFGIGSGRIIEASNSHLRLDETFDIPVDTYRLRIRGMDNVEQTVTADLDANGQDFNFTTPLGSAPETGSLVLVEVTTIESVDLLVTGMTHEDDLVAMITAVPAAPAVLTAAGGTIPDYSPTITGQIAFGPPKPVVVSLVTGETVAKLENDGSLTPRIGVIVGTLNTIAVGGTYLRIRWRITGSGNWSYSRFVPYRSEITTRRLSATLAYDVQVATFDDKGRSRGWVNAGNIVAETVDNLLPAPTGWVGRVGIDSITLIRPAVVDINVKHYVIYAATDISTALVEVGTTKTNQFTYRPPDGSGYTRYKVAIVDREDREGLLTDFIEVEPSGVLVGDLSTGVSDIIQDAQDAADAAAADATQALLDALNAQNDIDGFAVDHVGLTADVVGGKIAGIRATSWADPDGSGGGVLELLGDVIAQGTIATNKMVVGLNRNIIENSDFNNGWLGITQFEAGTIGSGSTVSIRQDGAYSGLFNPTIRVRTEAENTSTGYVGINFVPPSVTGGAVPYGYPVEEGKFVEFSARLCVRRVNVSMRIYWYDADGVALATPYTTVASISTTGTIGTSDIASWLQYGNAVEVPVGARHAVPDIRITSSNAASGEIRDTHIYQPMFAVTQGDDVPLSGYSPGGTTLISGGRIITDELIANSITADKINGKVFRITQSDYDISGAGTGIEWDGSTVEYFTGPVVAVSDIFADQGLVDITGIMAELDVNAGTFATGYRRMVCEIHVKVSGTWYVGASWSTDIDPPYAGHVKPLSFGPRPIRDDLLSVATVDAGLTTPRVAINASDITHVRDRYWLTNNSDVNKSVAPYQSFWRLMQVLN